MNDRCRGCGKKIEWIEYTDRAGETKRIPLDPAPPTYRFDPVEMRYLRSDAKVSHFATCTNLAAVSREPRQLGFDI